MSAWKETTNTQRMERIARLVAKGWLVPSIPHREPEGIPIEKKAKR